jgi:hypothetical protein
MNKMGKFVWQSKFTENTRKVAAELPVAMLRDFLLVRLTHTHTHLYVSKKENNVFTLAWQTETSSVKTGS